MAAIIYLLCALTAFLCAWLIMRSYFRNRQHLLLWSGLCFWGLFINNFLLVVDRLVLPTEIDLTTLRLSTGLAALLLLLYGLIWEEE